MDRIWDRIWDRTRAGPGRASLSAATGGAWVRADNNGALVEAEGRPAVGPPAMLSWLWGVSEAGFGGRHVFWCGLLGS